MIEDFIKLIQKNKEVLTEPSTVKMEIIGDEERLSVPLNQMQSKVAKNIEKNTSYYFGKDNMITCKVPEPTETISHQEKNNNGIIPTEGIIDKTLIQEKKENSHSKETINKEIAVKEKQSLPVKKMSKINSTSETSSLKNQLINQATLNQPINKLPEKIDETTGNIGEISMTNKEPLSGKGKEHPKKGRRLIFSKKGNSIYDTRKENEPLLKKLNEPKPKVTQNTQKRLIFSSKSSVKNKENKNAPKVEKKISVIPETKEDKRYPEEKILIRKEEIAYLKLNDKIPVLKEKKFIKTEIKSKVTIAPKGKQQKEEKPKRTIASNAKKVKPKQGIKSKVITAPKAKEQQKEVAPKVIVASNAKEVRPKVIKSNVITAPKLIKSKVITAPKAKEQQKEVAPKVIVASNAKEVRPKVIKSNVITAPKAKEQQKEVAPKVIVASNAKEMKPKGIKSKVITAPKLIKSKIITAPKKKEQQNIANPKVNISSNSKEVKPKQKEIKSKVITAPKAKQQQNMAKPKVKIASNSKGMTQNGMKPKVITSPKTKEKPTEMKLNQNIAPKNNFKPKEENKKVSNPVGAPPIHILNQFYQLQEKIKADNSKKSQEKIQKEKTKLISEIVALKEKIQSLSTKNELTSCKNIEVLKSNNTLKVQVQAAIKKATLIRKEKNRFERENGLLQHKNKLAAEELYKAKNSEFDGQRKLEIALRENDNAANKLISQKSFYSRQIEALEADKAVRDFREAEALKLQKAKDSCFAEMGISSEVSALEAYNTTANKLAKEYFNARNREYDFHVLYTVYEVPEHNLKIFGEIGNFLPDRFEHEQIVRLKSKFNELTKRATPEANKLFKLVVPYLTNCFDNLEQITKNKPFGSLLPGILKILSECIISPFRVFSASALYKTLQRKEKEIQNYSEYKEKLNLDFFRYKQLKMVKKSIDSKRGIQETCKKILALNRQISDLISKSKDFETVKKLRCDTLELEREEAQAEIKKSDEDIICFKNAFKTVVGKSNSQISLLRKRISQKEKKEKPTQIFDISHAIKEETKKLEKKFARKIEMLGLQKEIDFEEDKKLKLKEDLFEKIKTLKLYSTSKLEVVDLSWFVEKMVQTFVGKIKGVLSFDEKLSALDSDYYDVFEELYMSYFDDSENAKLKSELMDDELNELENKLEMLLAIEEIEKSTEIQQRIVSIKRNKQNMTTLSHTHGITLKKMDNDEEAEEIRKRIPNRKSIQQKVAEKLEEKASKNEALNKRMIERLESRINEIKRRGGVDDSIVVHEMNMLKTETRDKMKGKEDTKQRNKSKSSVAVEIKENSKGKEAIKTDQNGGRSVVKRVTVVNPKGESLNSLDKTPKVKVLNKKPLYELHNEKEINPKKLTQISVQQRKPKTEQKMIVSRETVRKAKAKEDEIETLDLESFAGSGGQFTDETDSAKISSFSGEKSNAENSKEGIFATFGKIVGLAKNKKEKPGDDKNETKSGESENLREIFGNEEGMDFTLNAETNKNSVKTKTAAGDRSVKKVKVMNEGNIKKAENTKKSSKEEKDLEWEEITKSVEKGELKEYVESDKNGISDIEKKGDVEDKELGSPKKIVLDGSQT